jgi:hypothetical protein
LGQGDRTPVAEAWLDVDDEPSISLTPPVLQARAPKGQTAIMRAAFNEKPLAIAAVLAHAPEVSEPKECSAPNPAPINYSNLIEFSRQPRRQFNGDKVTDLFLASQTYLSKDVEHHRTIGGGHWATQLPGR